MKLQFMESLRTGHNDIDDDHADIIETINDVMQMVQDGDTFAQVPAHLDTFVHTCETHFRNEERILADANYPHLAQHTADHDLVLANAHTARRNFGEADNQEDRRKHLESMIGFLLDDILSSDMAFASFLQAKGLAHGRA